LVIDDDEDLCKLLNKLLAGSGLNVARAATATDGLAMLKQKAPHIVLLDINLGGESGLTFLKEKRELPNSDFIPVVMMSSQTDKRLLSLSLALGAVDFLAKPINSQKLLLKIKKHMRDGPFPKASFAEDDNEAVADIQCDGKISHINEVSCLLNTSSKIKNGTDLKLESVFLNEMGLGSISNKAVGFGLYTSSGHFDNEIAFVGINEEKAKKIRIMKTYVKK